ncbi:MAG: hypothetical protein ACE14M_01815 [Terriglobales bacterium]
MQTLLIIFIIVTSVAVVIQMAILAALYATVKKSSARVESLANEVQARAIPTLDAAQAMITEYRPKLDSIISNVAETSALVKDEVARLDTSVTEVVDRARMQVMRADALLSRTLDRVEYATEVVQHTVVSPIRQASGVLQGVTATIGVLFGKGRSRRRGAMGSNDDEMFI